MIEDGSVTVGHWIRLLYERIISDLENKSYFFDQKKANRAVRFFEKFCHHSKGRLAPQLVKLETWQKALISCIFGLVDENGIRVYREVFVVMGRKNGKSLLASGIAEYLLLSDSSPTSRRADTAASSKTVGTALAAAKNPHSFGRMELW